MLNSFIQEVNELNEQIIELHKCTITDIDKIMCIIKHTHSHISNDIKFHIITNHNIVIRSIESIMRCYNIYIKKNLNNDEILIKLREREIVKENSIDIIYKVVLEYIIKEYLDSDILDSDNIYSDSDSDNIYSDNKPTEFNFRINQEEAFKKLEQNGLVTGILNSATGTGKSYIILRYIAYAYEKFKENCKIILFTERVSILKDLFELGEDKQLLLDKIEYWKRINVGDLSKLNIIDRVTIKKYDWVDSFKESGPVLLLINRAFLSNNTLYTNLKKDNISLIIHDECHNTTSTKCYNIVKYFHDMNIPIIGFSATPIRTGASMIKRLASIYTSKESNKINLIIDYGLIFAIKEKLIVPPIFNWFYFEDYTNDTKYEVSDLEVESILKCLDEKIDLLPYKKMIAWGGYIELTELWLSKIIIKLSTYPTKYKKLKNLKFFADLENIKEYGVNIGTYKEFKKIDSNGIMFCARKHREGSDIKNLDSCIFLDKAHNREPIPFIQSIGRVLRNNTNKEYGYIFDGIKLNCYKDMTDKITDYYQTIQNLTSISELSNSEHNERLNKISNMISFDTKTIKLTINDVVFVIETMMLNESQFKKIKKEMKSRIKIENCRDPLLCMYDGDMLRHTIKNDHWDFYYDKNRNVFTYNNIDYTTINRVTQSHYRLVASERGVNNNAWKECKILRDNKWISTYDLPLI